MAKKKSEVWQCWMHFPGLVIDTDSQFAIAGGTLLHIDHATWASLDLTLWQPVDYNESAPVFFYLELTGGRGRDGVAPELYVLKSLIQRVKDLHRALLLEVVAPFIPDPDLSCGYVKAQGDERPYLFLIGVCGRDWILSGHYHQPRHELDTYLVARAALVFKYLVDLRTAYAGSRIEAAMVALEAASLPDLHADLVSISNYQLTFVSCVAALEHLMLPPVPSGHFGSLSAAFAAHGAALMARTFDTMPDWSQRIRKVYQLRSDIMHGRRTCMTFNDDEVETVILGICLIQTALRFSLLILSQRPESALPDFLAGAASDEHQHALFRKLIDASGLTS